MCPAEPGKARLQAELRKLRAHVTVVTQRFDAYSHILDSSKHILGPNDKKNSGALVPSWFNSVGTPVVFCKAWPV